MQPKMFARGVSCVVVLAAVLIVQVGCGGGGPASHDSPQAAFDAAQAAAKKKDYNALCNCFTPESLDVMAGSMIMGASMMKAMGGLAALGGEKAKQDFEASCKVLDDVLAKHGVTEDHLKSMQAKNPAASQKDMEAAFPKLTAPIKDKPAFIGEITNPLDSINKGKPGGMGQDNPTEMFEGKLENIKIEGDRATAQVVLTPEGKEQRESIGFKRVNGSWLIELMVPKGN